MNIELSRKELEQITEALEERLVLVEDELRDCGLDCDADRAWWQDERARLAVLLDRLEAVAL
jgi:hypothetical protein